MLHHLTWHQYLAAVIMLAVLYYLIIMLRCFRPELQRIMKQLNSRRETGHLPEALQYRPEAERPAKGVMPHDNLNLRREYRHEMPTEYDHLAAELKACIAKAADQPFAPAVLIPQLKTIVKMPIEITKQVDRQMINELIVNECEKTGTALLTVDEVNQWWGD